MVNILNKTPQREYWAGGGWGVGVENINRIYICSVVIVIIGNPFVGFDRALNM